jgi:hypothetical protein
VIIHLCTAGMYTLGKPRVCVHFMYMAPVSPCWCAPGTSTAGVHSAMCAPAIPACTRPCVRQPYQRALGPDRHTHAPCHSEPQRARQLPSASLGGSPLPAAGCWLSLARAERRQFRSPVESFYKDSDVKRNQRTLGTDPSARSGPELACQRDDPQERGRLSVAFPSEPAAGEEERPRDSEGGERGTTPLHPSPRLPFPSPSHGSRRRMDEVSRRGAAGQEQTVADGRNGAGEARGTEDSERAPLRGKRGVTGGTRRGAERRSKCRLFREQTTARAARRSSKGRGRAGRAEWSAGCRPLSESSARHSAPRAGGRFGMPGVIVSTCAVPAAPPRALRRLAGDAGRACMLAVCGHACGGRDRSEEPA